MKQLILITFFSLSFLAAKAQSKTTDPKDTTIYNIVDVQPMYTGGFVALTEFLKSNLQPGDDKGKGMVIAYFVVEKDGSLSHIRAVRSPSVTAAKETVRVIASFPKWQPAVNKDKIVRCSFTMPIRF